jgi:hypothetical protein
VIDEGSASLVEIGNQLAELLRKSGWKSRSGADSAGARCGERTPFEVVGREGFELSAC